MKTRWQLERGTRTDSVDLADGQVFVGTDEGFGHGSSGAAATYAEFLGGKLNGLVEETFGSAVLSEVRASVVAAA
jgi:hypothetical protein